MLAAARLHDNGNRLDSAMQVDDGPVFEIENVNRA
jgi:hypothetical protein